MRFEELQQRDLVVALEPAASEVGPDTLVQDVRVHRWERANRPVEGSVELARIESLPGGISSDRAIAYFRILKRGPHWNEVIESRTLAVCVPRGTEGLVVRLYCFTLGPSSIDRPALVTGPTTPNA